MANNQSDGFESLVIAPDAHAETSKNIFDEIYATPSSHLSDARKQSECNRLQNSSTVFCTTSSSDSELRMAGDSSEVVLNMMPDPGDPNFEGADNRQQEPPTKWEELQMFLLQEAILEARMKIEADKAITAITDDKFEDLSKIIKEVAKGGKNEIREFRGMFNLKRNVQLGDVGADGSFELKFDEPNADDTDFRVKVVQFDKDSKVAGAELRHVVDTAGYKTYELDPKVTFKELKQRIEQFKEKSKD